MSNERRKGPPSNRDLTAGMVPDSVCNFVDSTGDQDLDERILDLVKSVVGVDDFCLLAEMIATAVGMARGVGTQDEIFEALTLIQTGKAKLYPIVCLDAPGGTYWKSWKKFVEEHLYRLGMISASDFSLFKVTDDVEEALSEIIGFYRNFHSYRYVGDRLVVRLQDALTDEAMADLNQRFAGMVKSGSIEACDALPEEGNEADLADLPRIVLRHWRCDFGLLREFINALNGAQIRE